MKRSLALGALFAIAVASLLFAQTSGRATLRTPAGEQPFTYLEQSGQVYVSAEDVIAGLGGTLVPDSSGYKVTIDGVGAAFGTDSQYAVVRDDLIEMPVPAIVVEGSPYVPWQFFQGLLANTRGLDVIWDQAAAALVVRPMQRDVVGVGVSLANVQGISKVVLTLSGPLEYAVETAPSAYLVRFRGPIRPPFQQQAYEDPYIRAVVFSGSEMRIMLSAPDIIGDAYQLENPPRVVIDFRKAATPEPGLAPSPVPSRPQDRPGIRTIVIDPGHGGKEVGAVGPNGVLEKDITLAISRRLADALNDRLGARVVLTRTDDSVVSLDQRTAIANQYEADLFLSVHLNAAVIADAKGSETYFLSLEASDELARKAAETENASAGSSPSGADSDLKLILWDLAQQAYLDESSHFAQTIQEEMNAATAVANRGVKQAPFKVLIGATMPAALVEVGFITNPEEEAKLQTDAFQSLMVKALVDAVERYKNDYETRIGLNQRPAPAAAAAPASAAPAAPSPERAATSAAPRTRTER